VRGLNFEDFAGTKESQKETGADCQCIMSSANSILRASAEKIDELFGMRFLHNRDATMAADPTASPLFDPNTSITIILREKFVEF